MYIKIYYDANKFLRILKMKINTVGDIEEVRAVRRSSCVVEKPKIPPASTTGKNILSILVNSIRKFKKFLK